MDLKRAFKRLAVFITAQDQATARGPPLWTFVRIAFPTGLAGLGVGTQPGNSQKSSTNYQLSGEPDVQYGRGGVKTLAQCRISLDGVEGSVKMGEEKGILN